MIDTPQTRQYRQQQYRQQQLFDGSFPSQIPDDCYIFSVIN
jgi:hypothetical protein